MEGALDLFAMAAALADDEPPKGHELDATQLEAWRLPAATPPGLPRCQAPLDAEAFRRQFEAANLPVLVDGCAEDWPAARWTLDGLQERFGEEPFALYTGQQFPLREFLAYARGRGESDPAPLYLFEDLSLCKPDTAKYRLLEEYAVPECFSRDLFNLGAARGLQQAVEVEQLEGRPRFRWLLAGPARSGTKMHVDPIGTSAWNTLLSGHKRWVLAPPSSDGAAPAALRVGSDHTVQEWFAHVLPELDAQALGLIEFTQRPGETIFVPAGWWHTVVNLDLTLAVTQNFASECRLEQVAEAMRQQRDSPFKRQWFATMAARFPDCDTLWPTSLPRSFAGGHSSVARQVVRPGLWASANGSADSDAAWLAASGARYASFAAALRKSIGQENEAAHVKRVPRVVHHIWLGPDPVPGTLLKSWTRFHHAANGWKVRVWRDADVEALGLRNKAAYEAASNWGEKSDIARYEILARHGGVYADVDFECVASFEDLLLALEAGCATFAAGMSNTGAVEINNGLLIAAPGDAVLERLVAAVRPRQVKPAAAAGSLQAVLAGGFLAGTQAANLSAALESSGVDPAMDTISRTGPGLVTRELLPALEQFPGALVLPAVTFYPAPNDASAEAIASTARQPPSGCFAVHHWHRSWQAATSS